MAEIQIGVVGCGGRMGRALIRTIVERDGCALAGGAEAPGHNALGLDLGVLAGLEHELGQIASDDLEALFAASDAVVDFTVPDATAANARLAVRTNTNHIVGTTGLDADHQAAIEAAAKDIVVVQAPNYSLGINLLMALTRQVAQTLDPAFDIEVWEMHHRHKIDAPSGTALALGKAAAEGRGVDLDDVADRARDGITGARRPGDIGFAVSRGGNVAGDHTVVFAADDERLELTHKAGDRAIFARGAVQAALWSRGQSAGLYSMADVLGL